MKLSAQQKKVAFVVIVAVCLAALLAVFFYGKQKAGKETQEPSQAQPQGPTKEEILEGLSAPSGGPPPTEKEKQEILKGLSAPAPSGTRPPTEEEKRAILEALSQPQQ